MLIKKTIMFAFLLIVISASIYALTINLYSPSLNFYNQTEVLINFSASDAFGINKIWVEFDSSISDVLNNSVVSEGETAEVSCPSDYQISDFNSFYATNCNASACGSCINGENNCSVTFNNGNCGDPCVGTVKQGELEITCSKYKLSLEVPKILNNSVVSEGLTAKASCPGGYGISNYSSIYGTNCNPTDCGTCTLGETSCSVVFDNINCGDVCPGTVKQGELNISCSSLEESIQELFNFTEGNHNLQFYAEDTNNNIENTNFSFIIDTIAPIIMNTKPSEGDILSEMRKNISADISDPNPGSGIDTTSIVLKLNNVQIIPNITVTNASIVKINWHDNLGAGFYTVDLTVKDLAGNMQNKIWNFTIDPDAVNFTIFSPIDNGIYNNRFLPVNITSVHKLQSLRYYSWWDMNTVIRSKTYPYVICTNCNSTFIFCSYCNYALKRVQFLEGWNNITFLAVDMYGNSQQINRTFFIDSSKPRIISTLPKSGTYTNGSLFSVKYTEENLKNITLYYGNSTKTKSKTKTNCLSGIGQSCDFVNIDLSIFNGQKINYWFVINDFINNASSKKVSINVDSKIPSLNVNLPINSSIYAKYVPFKISSNEKIDIYYTNQFGIKRSLCSSCNSYNSNIFFAKGDYNITITGRDLAGNQNKTARSFRVI